MCVHGKGEREVSGWKGGRHQHSLPVSFLLSSPTSVLAPSPVPPNPSLGCCSHLPFSFQHLLCFSACWHLQTLHVSDCYSVGVLEYGSSKATFWAPLTGTQLWAMGAWLWVMVATLITTQHTSTGAGPCPSVFPFLLKHAQISFYPISNVSLSHITWGTEDHLQSASATLICKWNGPVPVIISSKEVKGKL